MNKNNNWKDAIISVGGRTIGKVNTMNFKTELESPKEVSFESIPLTTYEGCMKGVTFDDINKMHSYMDRVILDAHERFLKDILRQLLNREPTIDDAKKLTKVTNPEFPNQYGLVYENTILGMVKNHFDNDDFQIGQIFFPGGIHFKND